jgi:hypothetical protein
VPIEEALQVFFQLREKINVVVANHEASLPTGR